VQGNVSALLEIRLGAVEGSREDYGVGVATTRWLASGRSGTSSGGLLHVWDGGVNSLASNGEGTYTLVNEGWTPRADYGFAVGTTHWLASDISGDAWNDLVHLWNGGVNTLISAGDGTTDSPRKGGSRGRITL